MPFFAIIALLANPVNIRAQQSSRDIYRDESAAGARAAMGLFANGYSRAFAAYPFNLRPRTVKNRLVSAMLAAAGYQLLSFNTQTGLEIKPAKFNKAWNGYWTGYFTAEGLDVFLHLLSKYNGMKFVFGSTLMAATGIMVIEGEARQTWRYADDGPLTFRNLITNRYSYWVHFAGSGGLYWAITRHTHNKELALGYTAFLIWLWEVKDGYLWYEDVGYLGGDGFSWSDGWAGTIAAVGSYAVSKLLSPGRNRTAKSALQRAGGRDRKLFFLVFPGKENIAAQIRVSF
jgi:hypothetical protein